MMLSRLTTAFVLAFVFEVGLANRLSETVENKLEPDNTKTENDSDEKEGSKILQTPKWASSLMNTFFHQETELDEEEYSGLPLKELDCDWAAIGFEKYSSHGCAVSGDTEDEAEENAEDEGCNKIFAFNNGCAAVVWNEDPYAYGYKRSTSKTKKELIAAAKKTCRGSKERECDNYEYDCPPCASPGRPFLDSDNNVLQAEALVEDTPSWSKLDHSTDAIDPIFSESESQSYSMDLQNVGYDWAKRGLGEHASVASFAAVTLALMTNGAPPSLIRDSLLAALDEVNHAQLSFEVASLFLGQAMEPGALPQSSHKFNHNMTALALGAAREGCVDETLSALDAAAEVDQLEHEVSEHLGEHRAMVRERVRTIAFDEGRHSSLAWRTVRWACSQDARACEVVKKEVFDHKKLSDAANKRFPSGMLDKAFEEIYEKLVPFVTGQGSHDELLTVFCNAAVLEEGTDDKKMLDIITSNIVKGALCESV